MIDRLLHIALVLVLPPLLLGIINKTKAWFAGRQGQPLLQTYWDIARLLRKGAVFSRTTTWVFQVGSTVQLATTLCVAIALPMASAQSPFGFAGDVLATVGLLSLGRFFTIISAMDTGSSFEGLGASREATIASFAEPALFLCLAALCVPAHAVSYGRIWSGATTDLGGWSRAPSVAVAIALFIIMLAECSRIPVDDPNTHLELTMVHEVMVLDHSGPDLALITLGIAMKLALMGSLIAHVLVPTAAFSGWPTSALLIATQLALAVAVGAVESVSARFRLNRIPQFMMAASVVAVLALAMQFYRGAL